MDYFIWTDSVKKKEYEQHTEMRTFKATHLTFTHFMERIPVVVLRRK